MVRSFVYSVLQIKISSVVRHRRHTRSREWGVVVKEMVAKRRESAGFASGTSYLTYTLTCQEFLFLLLPSFLWFRTFDGGREIKTVQVHVEVEINCGRKRNMHGSSFPKRGRDLWKIYILRLLSVHNYMNLKAYVHTLLRCPWGGKASAWQPTNRFVCLFIFGWWS